MKARLFFLAALAAGCGPSSGGQQQQVVKTYAINLEANYAAVVVKVQALKDSIDSFVAAPSAGGLDAVKQAWLDARPVYGECEYSRFYGGPIDQAQGRMNEWPIDENFIDYTAGNPMGGIINDLTDYPQITPEILATADEKGGIENLSLGFHALEFLLWGQRPDQTSGPGKRPYTDYVDGGTAPNPDRRRLYLQTAAQMLLADMQGLDADWHLDDPNSYGSQLVAGSTTDGLTKMMNGFSQMAISELLYERMDDPYVTQDRKDEESCFSENTLVDLIANALGVEDVYLGRYQSMNGPSLSDLVKAKDPILDMTMRAQLSAARAAVEAIPPPFDLAVLAPPDSDPNLKVQAAIAALMPLRDTMKQAATTLGLQINL